MEKSSFIRQNILPVLAAFIWGTAFVAQSVGADYLEPFSFTTARSLIAFFFLLGLCAILYWRREKTGAPQPGARPGYRRDLLLGGLCCGTALMLGTNLQQKGIETTASGKAGFITALYIVIVPILGLFLKKKASRGVWVSVALAVAGLYCLCIKEGFSVEPGDVYLFLCSLCFAVQILSIDHFAQKVDGVELSCAQFLVVALESAVGMLAAEHPTLEGLRLCMGPLLYVGILSSGVAYTLQIVAQKGSNPTVVSLLLSLESVFATLAGALVLGDRMSGREYLGCVLMLAAVVLAQLPDRRRADAERAET